MKMSGLHESTLFFIQINKNILLKVQLILEIGEIIKLK